MPKVSTVIGDSNARKEGVKKSKGAKTDEGCRGGRNRGAVSTTLHPRPAIPPRLATTRLTLRTGIRVTRGLNLIRPDTILMGKS